MSSTRGMPVALTVASLASVIKPSGLIATSASRLDSIIERAASNACIASVTSREMVDAPTIAPSALRIGEMLSETGNTFPSFRIRKLSKHLTGWPNLIAAKTAVISWARSSGHKRVTDLPSISSLQ